MAGGYTYEHRMRTVLHGLGFAPDEYSRPIGMLSGGQKTRALLARLLLEAPDLLALDEPTNHLDIQSVEWLEGYLKDFPGAVLVVSHDRYFMDAVATDRLGTGFRPVGDVSRQLQRITPPARGTPRTPVQGVRGAAGVHRQGRGLYPQHMGSRIRARRRAASNAWSASSATIWCCARDATARWASDGRHHSQRRQVLPRTTSTVGYPDDPEPLFYRTRHHARRGQVAALIGPNGVGQKHVLKTVIGQARAVGRAGRAGAAVNIGYFAQAHERLTR